MEAPFKEEDAVWLKNDQSQYEVVKNLRDVNYIIKPLENKEVNFTKDDPSKIKKRSRQELKKQKAKALINQAKLNKVNKIRINNSGLNLEKFNQLPTIPEMDEEFTNVT
ncbi:hypothetical protein BpHYR1_002870 [Brachionus plicatilis]|uniref:Uncharacterized protein n=1 Tax=Brachionus plicatilis TaxID=10195 RepID=A0A3M7PE91_BRAPC|nr:hypothetical protein BpHYR1_002870 [Brachionus plicatilis]